MESARSARFSRPLGRLAACMRAHACHGVRLRAHHSWKVACRTMGQLYPWLMPLPPLTVMVVLAMLHIHQARRRLGFWAISGSGHHNGSSRVSRVFGLFVCIQTKKTERRFESMSDLQERCMATAFRRTAGRLRPMRPYTQMHIPPWIECCPVRQRWTSRTRRMGNHIHRRPSTRTRRNLDPVSQRTKCIICHRTRERHRRRSRHRPSSIGTSSLRLLVGRLHDTARPWLVQTHHHVWTPRACGEMQAPSRTDHPLHAPSR